MIFFRKIIIFSITFICYSLDAQNLVSNSSFEDTLYCPISLGDMGSVDIWWNPTWASPDVFHSCNSLLVSVPQNAFGFQLARTGISYCGVLTSDFSESDYREYIQTQLITPLIGGEKYVVRMYVSRADSAQKACDRLGAYFSQAPISMEDNLTFPYLPQVRSEDGSPVIEDEEWVLIMDTLIATGGEEYMTIGVFGTNEEVTWIEVEGGWEQEAHYFIDDVSVHQIIVDGLQEEEFTVEAIYNESIQSIILNSNYPLFEYQLYSLSGALVLSASSNANYHEIDTSYLSKGIFILVVQTELGNSRKKIIVY